MKNPKQEIFDILYQFEGGESVLDVGCGDGWQASRVAFKFASIGCDWSCVDLKLDGVDWYDCQPKDYDVIIANDLFPNVDQRLELFLEKYLPHCKEMRLSLTYFDEPKWYRATRPEGEVITMLAWNESQIVDLVGYNYDVLKKEEYQGTFPNGRKVVLVWLKGGLA